jgi:hypothetical protein
MNDTMNIQKVFSPISPAQRVHRLKKEHPDSQKKGFERDLEEEKDGEKDEKEGAPILETAKVSNEEKKPEEGNLKEGSADPSAEIKKHNSHGTVGTLVDIQV